MAMTVSGLTDKMWTDSGMEDIIDELDETIEITRIDEEGNEITETVETGIDKTTLKTDGKAGLEKLAKSIVEYIRSDSEVSGISCSGSLNAASLITTAPGSPVVHVPPTGAPVSVDQTISVKVQ